MPGGSRKKCHQNPAGPSRENQLRVQHYWQPEILKDASRVLQLNVPLDFRYAKTQSAFKMSDIRGGLVACFMDEHSGLASFRRTRDWPNNNSP
jgi:hypothetical protein